MKIRFPVFSKDHPSEFEMFTIIILGFATIILLVALTMFVAMHIGFLPTVLIYFITTLIIALCTGMITIEFPQIKKDDA